MPNLPYFVIDFDSTFTQVEALDELARISLIGKKNQQEVFEKIEALTNKGMDGTLSFAESLHQRIALLSATQKDLDALVKFLNKKVSVSFKRNKAFFEKNAAQVLIVSGGFKEFILPVVEKYGILPQNVYANTFIFDKNQQIIGYDTQNPLSKDGGKVILLKELNLPGEIYGIGDGYSDFQLKAAGYIKHFFAFTENISRSKVIAEADYVVPSFDEFLYINQLPMSISYPKNRIKVAIIGNIPEVSLELLKKEGYSLISANEGIEEAGVLVANADAIITEQDILQANKLKIIIYLGNSKKNIPLALCTQRGIVVFDDRKTNKNNATFLPKRAIDFMNYGITYLSVNMPNIQAFDTPNSHRLIHIHANVPGIMAQLNVVFSAYNINILAQYLRTNDTVGYCITDINTEYDKKLLEALKKIPQTVKFRVLY